jgi:hypothetical protein
VILLQLALDGLLRGRPTIPIWERELAVFNDAIANLSQWATSAFAQSGMAVELLHHGKMPKARHRDESRLTLWSLRHGPGCGYRPARRHDERDRPGRVRDRRL